MRQSQAETYQEVAELQAALRAQLRQALQACSQLSTAQAELLRAL